MQREVTEGFLSIGLTWSNYILKIQKALKFENKGTVKGIPGKSQQKLGAHFNIR